MADGRKVMLKFSIDELQRAGVDHSRGISYGKQYVVAAQSLLKAHLAVSADVAVLCPVHPSQVLAVAYVVYMWVHLRSQLLSRSKTV